jgi:predicted nucleotidyltransferase
MRIHNWLEDLLDNTSYIRIIRLLFQYQGKEFTEREIAEHIRMSPNTVNLALRDIRKTNIFSFRKVGRAHAYSLNKDSALYKPLKELIESEERILKDMFDRIGRILKNSLSCVVFGSFARGDESFDSDLDLLIIVEDKESISESLDELRFVLSELYDTALSAFVLTPKELRKKWNKGFLKEVIREGILISGKELEELHGKGS